MLRFRRCSRYELCFTLEEWKQVDGPALDVNQGAHNTLYGADTTAIYELGHGVGHRLQRL